MQKVTTTLIDDIDGTEATETVWFGIDGKELEIDLSEQNAGVLRDILGDYVAHARKAGRLPTGSGGLRRAASATARASRGQTAAIRDWARKVGHSVSDRGRIAAPVVEAFEEAHRGLAAVG